MAMASTAPPVSADREAHQESIGTPAGAERASLLHALERAVGKDHVLTDAGMVEPFRHDMQPLAAAGIPLAVVRPRTTEEVAAVVKACHEAGVGIVPRGAGSGMTGAANAQDGAVSLVLTRMTDVEIDVESRLATVQPGVVTLDLKKRALADGLFYAPDPTSSDWCTIGGNLANGSAGPCGAKYGVTGDAVRGLEVVLASGEILHTGRATLKGVTGYDLNRLFVGSEGTLGIITSATLALQSAPPAPTTCIAAFASVAEAVQSVTELLAGGHRLSLLEIMDEACLGAVERHLGSQLLDDAPTPAAVLFGQSDAGTGEAIEAFALACENGGAALVYTAEDDSESEMLMQYWHGLEAALETMGTWILHEVTVPRRRVGELIGRIRDAGDLRGLFVGVHGHAADGTVHPMIVFDPAADGEREAARALYDDILDIALGLGGPVTGEHGIGRMKMDRLPHAVGEAGMAVHRAIKGALDPRGILNPGCMVPAETQRSHS